MRVLLDEHLPVDLALELAVALAPTQHQTGASATMVLEGSKAELPSAVTTAAVGTSVRPYGQNREA